MMTATIVSMTELSVQPHSGDILRYCKVWLNTYFFDSNIPCLLHDSRIISSHLHDTALWLCLWKQLSASLNIKNTGTKRQAFYSLYRHIDMNYQCECVASCKLSKEKLPHNTKFDNVCVRLYLQIRTPNKLHAGLDQINLFW